MSVVAFGFGACSSSIGVYGWGSCECIDNVPSIFAELLSSSKAYSCVITREYVQISERSTGQVLLRARPSEVTLRTVSQLANRDIVTLSKRSTGWPSESNIICEDT